MTAYAASLKEAFQYRYLLKNLVMKDLKLRYRNTALGFFWTMLDPALTACVFWLVFSVIAKWAIENYTLFLLCGMFPWGFFQYSLSASSASIMQNGGLFRRIKFPREIIPVSVVGSAMINFVIQLGVLLVISLACGINPGWRLALLPVVVAVEFLFCLGFCFFISALTVFVRDMGHLINILLNLWFFMTPVFYSPEMVRDVKWLYPIYRLNPMMGIVGGYRAIFYQPGPLNWAELGGASLVGFVLIAAGYRYFKNKEELFVEWM